MLMTIHAHIYNKTFSESCGEVKYNNRIHLSCLWLQLQLQLSSIVQ